MKLKILLKISAIIQILLGIWYFDWNSCNQIMVSTLQFLGGLGFLLILAKSEYLQKAGDFILFIGGIIVVFLIFKILFVG